MAINDYDNLIVGASNQYNVDPQLLKAVMAVESSGNPGAYNRSSGASGLMQFIPSTAQEEGVLPTDPVSSVYGGAAYLNELLTKYGNVDAALQHYSGGGGAPYARKILDAYHAVTPPAAAAPTPSTAPPAPAGTPTTDTDPSSPTYGEPTGKNFSRPATPGELTLDKGQAGQPGPNVRTTETTPHAPGGPTPPASEGGLPPGLSEILHGTSPPAVAPAEAPSSDQGLPPGLKDIIRPAAPAAPATAPAPTPAPSPTPAEPTAPPIYTAPTVPLIGKEQLSQTMPVSPPGGVPAITPENEAAFAGFSHGARQAVNPLLEFGSNVGNYVNALTGLPIATDRTANDIASEQAFQQQYGSNKIATGAATAARFATPLVLGGATGTALRLGLEAAQLPGAAEFVSGMGGTNIANPLVRLPVRMASGATAGATQGLVAGGPYGAITGAGLGGTLAPAAGGVAEWLTGRTASGAATQALQKIYQAASRDGMTPTQLDAAVAALGPEATFADVGGANLRALAEGTANAPGSGSQVAWNFLQQRAAGQTERLTQAVRDATGATGSAFENMEALQQARRAAAAPAYENAFNNTPVRLQASAQLAPYVDTPIGQRALQDGIANAQAEAVRAGEPFSLADYGVVQNPDGSFAIQPWNASLKTYDAIKRGYDQLAESLRDPVTLRINRSGTVQTPGGANISANTVIGMRDDVTRILRNSYPEYADALNAWAGPSADMDALSLGRRLLTTDADQTAANVANLTPSQRQMYQVGAAQALRDRIESVADSADATRRIFGNTQIRNRIAAGFGGEDTPAFQNFQNIMEREATYADSNRQYLQGSPTARRTVAIGEVHQPIGAAQLVEPALHLAMGGGVPAVAMGIARAAGNPLLARLAAPSDLYGYQLGNTLFNPAFRFGNLPSGIPRTGLRNFLVGPVGQQAGQLLLNDRTEAQ